MISRKTIPTERSGLIIQLTQEQSNMVAENHNLIYWYISLKHKETGITLELDEWYDLLAIELCYTIMKYDESKGSLANYYKLRCDGLVSKEYRKSQAQKRVHIGVAYIDEMNNMPTPNGNESLDWIEFINSINPEDKQIITLIYQGYTQKEVSKLIGVSQSYVSKILRRIGREYAEKANR